MDRAFPVNANPTRRVGLARALSKLGYCSRSDAADIIRAGRVRLNGAIRKDPESPVNLQRDRIEVDNRAIAASEKTYLILNKPRGIVTTASDEKGRPTVCRFLDPEAGWLAPVGRLDKASEGLLLFTNDSEWSARVLAPETHLDKTYHVQIGAVADPCLLRTLTMGLQLEPGNLLRVKAAQLLRGGAKNTWLEIVLDEGRNRHIRRMFEQLGIEVLRLVRVAIGPLSLGNLPKGATRPLSADEKRALDQAMRHRKKGR